MEVGHLERVEKPNKPVVYQGEVSLGRLLGEIFLIPAKEKRQENSPDFEVKMRTHGQAAWTVCGAAWRKKFNDGAGEFFSLSLDGPDFDKPYSVAAFPDDEQPKDTPKDRPAFYTLKWGRPRGGRDQAAEPGPVLGGDAIPY